MNIKIKNINYRQILTNVFMFILLLYPFNTSISTYIFKSNTICILLILISLIGIFMLGERKIRKKLIIILAVTLLIFLFVITNNYYWADGFEMKVIIYSMYIFLPFVMIKNKLSIKSFMNVIILFCLEHIFFTYFGLFFKDIYKEYILSFVCSGKSICTAIGNFYHGYIPGITTHFSTNAIYLSIATMYFFVKCMDKKSKINIGLFFISLVALFVAGKRAHLVFTMFSMIFLFFSDKKKETTTKILKFSLISCLGILIIIILSKYIPEIMNIFKRFEELIEGGNVLNGREKLYDLAYNLWDENLFIGKGWGAFSHYYQMILWHIGEIGYLDTHNVFLQLLCETGIIGFLVFTFIMLSTLIKNILLLYKWNDEDANELFILRFCLVYQIFFILYCFTGNPLYDAQCYVVYFMTIGFVYLISLKGGIYEKNRNYNFL